MLEKLSFMMASHRKGLIKTNPHNQTSNMKGGQFKNHLMKMAEAQKEERGGFWLRQSCFCFPPEHAAQQAGSRIPSLIISDYNPIHTHVAQQLLLQTIDSQC